MEIRENFEPTLTRHGEERLQQRGYTTTDIVFVCENGTRLDDLTWYFRDRDAEQAIRELKVLGEPREMIQRMERLKGTRVVMNGDLLVTVYKSSFPQKRKRKRYQGYHEWGTVSYRR